MLTDGVVLHHDNARPHAAATAETIRTLKFEHRPHPACSPDLSSYDYHVFFFWTAQDALRVRRFANDEEVEDTMYTWLRA